MVKRPVLVIFLSLGISVLLSILAISSKYGDDLFATPGSDSDLSHPTAINNQSLKLAVEYIQDNKVVLVEDDDKSVQAQQSKPKDVMILVFEASGENVFTRSMSEKAKEIQSTLLDQADYPSYCLRDERILANQTLAASLSDRELCKKPISPLNIFYASQWDQAQIDKAMGTIAEMDNFSEKSKEILVCVQQLPPQLARMITMGSVAFYAYGTFPDMGGMTMDDLLVALNAQCPDLQATSLTETASTFGVILSLVQMSKSFDGEGLLRDPTKVLELCAIMLEILLLRPMMDYFFDKNSGRDNLKSKYSRMLVAYGLPLQGFANFTDQADVQGKQYKDWFQTHFRDYLQGDATNSDTFKTYYLSTALIFDKFISIMLKDALLALFSVVFVFLFLILQTGSVFLAFAGMIEIIMSLPLAFGFYSYIFQFDYLAGFCSMCIYIVLAIGVDDIFVFMDAYKQSALEGPEVLKDFETRLSWVYRRAASAMLITSFTTMAAFVATAFSPLSTVKSFGIYAAFVILADFILVITFFPACVVLYHNNMELKGCCAGCRCCSKLAENSTEKYRKSGTKPERRRLEVLIDTKMAPFVNKFKFPLMLVFLVWIIIEIIVAIDVQPSEAADQFLPDDHPFQRMVIIMSEDFGSSSQNKYNEVELIWGIDSVDRTGVNMLYEKDFLGEVVFQ